MIILQNATCDFRNIVKGASLVETAHKIPDESNIKLSAYNIYIQSLVTHNQYLIFNCVSEALIKVCKDDLEEIKSLSCNNNLKQELIKMGIYVNSFDDEYYVANIKKYSYFVTNDTVKQFTILPTQQCNARCFYCFEEGIQRVSMNEETERGVIDFIARSVNENDTIIFDWFGGEPMCGENHIDKIINGVVNKLPNNSYKSIMISNGTLFTREKIKKYVNDWHLTRVQLTVDGNKEEHNKRKNLLSQNIDAYEKLKETIRLLLENNIEVFLRINYDKNNLYMTDMILEDMNEFSLYENFCIFPAMLKEHCTGALLTCFEEDEYSNIYKEIYKKMTYWGFVKYIDELLPNVKTKPCIAANLNTIVIDSDGMLYKCPQQFSNPSASIGSIYSGIFYNENLEFWMQPNEKLANCDECVLFPMCFGGCKYNTQKDVNISVCIKYKFLLESLIQVTDELYSSGKIKQRTL